MEQQNQQPQQNTQSQPPLSSPKKGIFNTKLKLFFIVALVTIVISVGGILLLRGFGQGPSTPQPQTQDTISPQVRKSFPTQGECEAETGKKCAFIMCDYVPPGKTFEEVCGKDFKKGWQATSEPAQVDTSDWQTYRSDQFELKYPVFLNEEFVVTINAPVEEYEVLPIETLHPQSRELNISALREKVNTKILLNSFQDKQKNHFDVYIGFFGKEEGIQVVFEYPKDSTLGVDEIALINKILSTFRFVK